MEISVAKQFSRTPGGRFRFMGPDSGEEFRDAMLKALKTKPPQNLIVTLDGVEGYGSSFLEEAFGGLIRAGVLPAEEILRRVRVIARAPEFETYALEARQYMADAAQRLSAQRA
jgi:hypothetical protein